MKKIAITFILAFISLDLYAPPNCEIYKNNESCYKSCKAATKAIRYKQGSYWSQQYFDESIELCPNFAYSYMEKAVPYLKRGKFITWKKLIDKAVELSPQEYLGYRAWCRLQFLRDYEGTIKDIEQLKKLTTYDIGYCQTGDYHLNIALALCYKEMGEMDKARMLFEEQLGSNDYDARLYDYYHFGVLEYQAENYQKAIEYLEKQIEVNGDLGETYYFLAMANKGLGHWEAYNEYLNKSEDYYRKGNLRTDTYAETIDKIYLIDILNEKNSMTN